jgi:hypothetical protein
MRLPELLVPEVEPIQVPTGDDAVPGPDLREAGDSGPCT